MHSPSLALVFTALTGALAGCGASASPDNTTGAGTGGSSGADGGKSAGGATSTADGGERGGAVGDGGSTGTGGGTAVGGSSGAAAQACADASKARCQRNDTCTNGIANEVRFGDLATCEARDTAGCTLALSASGTGATPDSTSSCGAALAAEPCADYLAGKPVADCAPQAGKGALGAACVYPAQCASTYCAVPIGAACGTCAALPKVADSCAVTGTCGTTLDCVKDTSVCAAPVAEGGACDKDNPCMGGLSCVGSARPLKGKCTASGQHVGAPCDPTEKTRPGCDRALGLYCNATTMKCDAATLVGPGKPCGVVAGGFAICSAGGACEMAVNAVSGTCAAPIADGSPCDTSTARGANCLPPARCVVTGTGTTGLCKMPDPTACK